MIGQNADDSTKPNMTLLNQKVEGKIRKSRQVENVQEKQISSAIPRA